MKITFIIFGLLWGTVIQAYPSKQPHSNGNGKQSCFLKLSSHKVITEDAKKKYEEFYQDFNKHLNKYSNPGLLKELEAKHTQFVKKVAELLKEYEDDIEELKLINNHETRQKLCKQFLNATIKKTIEVQKLAKDLKGQLVKYLNELGSKWWDYESLKKKMNTALNMFFAIDISAKLGIELFKLYEWETKVVDGIPIEEPTNVNRFVTVFNDLLEDQLAVGEIGTDVARTMENRISEFLSEVQSKPDVKSIDTVRAIEAAKARVAAKTAESWRAAVQTEESQTAELAAATKAAEAARAAEAVKVAETSVRTAEAVKAIQAVRAAETVRAAEAVRFAETAASAGSIQNSIGLASIPSLSTLITSAVALVPLG